jgi:hypothetical protein
VSLPPKGKSDRGLWFAIFVIVALIVSGATIALTWIGTRNKVGAITAGCGSFAATIYLALQVHRYFTE